MTKHPADPPAPDPTGPLPTGYWQGRYESGETGWDRGEASPVLDAWCDSEAVPGCRVLVPGCGRGHEVVALARRGFRVTGLDFAPAAVQALRGRLAAADLQADVVEADIFAYEPTDRFDAIYEQTCLCALAPRSWEAYERRLADWLLPGGHLVAAFMQTDAPAGPPFSCAPEAMRRLFAADRWEWPEALVPVPHPTGLVELAGIIRRRGPA